MELAGTWIDDLIRDLKNSMRPVEVRLLGRTLKNGRVEIIAWHKIQISNGLTEGANNLIKRAKRVDSEAAEHSRIAIKLGAR